MALTTEALGEIERMLAGNAAPQLAALRDMFPGIAWTRCDAEDVSEEPFLSFSTFDLHLIDATDHCVQITADPAQATGLLLAKRTQRP